MAEIKINTQNIVTGSIVIIAVLVGLGVWSAVQNLQSDVAVLEASVAELEEAEEQIGRLQTELAKVNADVGQIAAARDDILRTICQILERPVERCGVS